MEEEKRGVELQLAERKKKLQDVRDRIEAEKKKQMRIRSEYYEKAMAKESVTFICLFIKSLPN